MLKFQPFDYKAPPAPGLYWIGYQAPDWDVDVDDIGQTIGTATGQVLSKVALGYIERFADCAEPFQLIRVESDLGEADETALIRFYSDVKFPALPERAEAAEEWIDLSVSADSSVRLADGYYWVAFTKAQSGERAVTLAYSEVGGEHTAPLFYSLERCFAPLIELDEGDQITHAIPLTVPAYPTPPVPTENPSIVEAPLSDGERAILKRLESKPIELYWGRNGWIPDGLPKAAKRKDFDNLYRRFPSLVKIEMAKLVLVKSCSE